MYNMLKAEHLKQKRTFGRKMPIIAPCVILVLAFIFMAGIPNAYAKGAWNWWYVLFLSGSLAVSCYLNIKREKKSKYQNLLLIDKLPQKSWRTKILYCCMGLFFTNGMMFLGTWIGGSVLGTDISPIQGFIGAVLLTITYAWEVPLLLFLSVKFGMFASVFAGVFLSVSAVVSVSDNRFWWVHPAAIPMRLMCPVLGIQPNGLSIKIGSELSNRNVIPFGILLSVIWFLVLLIMTSNWFVRWEEK